MGRVINPDSAGKERTRLSKCIVLALRELMKEEQLSQNGYDAMAFIALSLQQIHSTIDVTVEAWEKRGYWVKADRFRMEWAWAGRVGEGMMKALSEGNFDAIPAYAVQIGQKLGKLKVSENNRLGKPWVGAWKALELEKASKRAR